MNGTTSLTQPPLDLPAILNIPPKLLPMVTDFNKYLICLLEGGRGSAKSHSVGRFLLYLGEERKLRIVCGREIQANIEESVHALLSDLIEEHQLAYDVYAHKIKHRVSGTVISFKGFREQGSVSVKGLEGVDILWIDEAQSITKHTLEIIMPTIRKENARVFFTMNRFLREDAVPAYCIGLPECLHIHINYYDNPFCPLVLKNQAETMRLRSQKDYDHIWLGHPISASSDYLFNFDKLHKSLGMLPFGELYHKQRVLGIDFAAQGDDLCVASVLDRLSSQHWGLTERIPWDEQDTMISVGKIVEMIGNFKPDITIIDIGGMGKVVFDRLNEVFANTGIVIIAFDGGSTDGIDTKVYGNIRSAAYHNLYDWFDSEFLCIEDKDKEVINQAEKLKFKYRSNGVRMIQSKVDMKKKPPIGCGFSPDDLDSVMMAVWGATKYIGKAPNSHSGKAGGKVTRKSGSRQRRRT